MEQETLKLREKEDDHTAEVKRWKENLRPRKKVFIAAIISLADLCRLLCVCGWTKTRCVKVWILFWLCQPMDILSRVHRK